MQCRKKRQWNTSRATRLRMTFRRERLDPDIKNGEPPFGPIHGWERNILGKNLPGFTCGPFLTTKDEVADPHNLHLQTRLNDEVMQDTKTDDLIFKLPEIIATIRSGTAFILATLSRQALPQVWVLAGTRTFLCTRAIQLRLNQRALVYLPTH